MDPQQKTAAPAVAGYIPEYSETPHSGSFDIAQHGLSSNDVARLTAEGRVNTQNTKSSRTLWSIMRAHLFTVFNFVLGACGAVVIMYQRWADLLFLGAVIANVVIGFVQEYKAKLELDRISLLDRSPATAVRDGKSVEVPMEQLVEGDVVILKRGDQVPADAVVLTSDSLELLSAPAIWCCRRRVCWVVPAASCSLTWVRILVQARFLMRRASSHVFSPSCVMR